MPSAEAHPKFGEMLSRFTDAFHAPLDPVVLMVRNDALPKLNRVEPLASFRDLVALSVIPYCRSLSSVFRELTPHLLFQFLPFLPLDACHE